MLYWLMKYVLLGPWLWLLFRPKVEGREHVPANGAAILASNHISFSDSIFLPLMVRRKVTFVAKSDYFTGTGVSGWAMKSLMHGLGAIAVNRGGGRAALTAFDAAIPVLKEGDLVGIYPEGTRSPDGRLYRGRTGVARLALSAGVPVIPVGVTGTEAVQPIGTFVPRLGHKVAIRFGKPMDFAGRGMDNSSLRAVTDDVMAEIQRLTGQEYVGRYAPRKSE